MVDVVVVGSGIVGASVAYHAARSGAAVTLLDRSLPGSGVTARSFAWIGASGVPPGPLAALRRSACVEWRRLEDELPEVRVSWTGSLSWGGLDPSASADVLAPDDDQELVGPEQVAALEPRLRRPPARALHHRGDGCVDPVAVTLALVEGARRQGAQVLPGCAVTALRTHGGRVTGVETSGGVLPAAVVVLAAGADVPGLAGPAGVHVPVTSSPAVLVRASAPAGLVRGVVAGPELEVRQAPDGTLLCAVEHRGETTADELLATGARTVAAVAAVFTGADPLRLVDARVGRRPMTPDGEPVVGPVAGLDGLYLTVLHSGVSLAAAVGRAAAQELVDGGDAAVLAGCRLDRFPAEPPAPVPPA